MDLAKLANEPLPASDLNEALPHLRRPFSPPAVKYKIQTVVNGNRAAIVVAYIDARLVIERLNAVVGAAWWPEYTPVEGGMECRLTVFGIPRVDVGMAQGLVAPKSLRSDALKRAAVLFGVGVSVYALQQAYLKVGAEDHELRTKKQKKRDGGEVQVPDLDKRTRAWLAWGYGEWLERTGERMFGPVLDHGDEADAAGVDEEGDEPDLSELPEAVSEEAKQERDQALERTRALAREGS